MVRRGDAVDFEGLSNLACAIDKCLGKTALSRWRVETICDEKGVFRKLGSPCNDGRHQCWMQHLLCTCARGRGFVGINRCILWHIHVQPCAEVRGVEKWETGMHNLEIDLDKVQRESERQVNFRARKASEETAHESEGKGRKGRTLNESVLLVIYRQVLPSPSTD